MLFLHHYVVVMVEWRSNNDMTFDNNNVLWDPDMKRTAAHF